MLTRQSAGSKQFPALRREEGVPFSDASIQVAAADRPLKRTLADLLVLASSVDQRVTGSNRSTLGEPEGCRNAAVVVANVLGRHCYAVTPARLCSDAGR